jgi:hypothetical protein
LFIEQYYNTNVYYSAEDEEIDLNSADENPDYIYYDTFNVGDELST